MSVNMNSSLHAFRPGAVLAALLLAGAAHAAAPAAPAATPVAPATGPVKVQIAPPAPALAGQPVPAAGLLPVTSKPTLAPGAAAATAQVQGDAVRGVVRAGNVAVLSSRIAARITKLPFKEGQSFRKGDLLVAFDCDRQQAELKAARAAHGMHQKTYTMQRELEAGHAIGRMEVDVTRSQMDKAAAEASAIEAGLRDCAIHAPYGGRVVEAMAQSHETANLSQPLMRIQGLQDLELQLIVPSAWMSWLRSGTNFSFKVDETGETVSASVLRVGAVVDPVSQTVKIMAKLPDARGQVLPGMSGTADFKRAGL